MSTVKTLEVLDRLEGHPDRYTRTGVIVLSEVGDRKRAWIYLLNHLPKEKLTQFTLIDDYSLEFHLASYVLPSERKPNGFIKQAWGGYE